MRNKVIYDAASPELDGRIPYRLHIGEDGKLLFSWLYTGTKKYMEPFFEGTLSACLSFPENAEGLPFTESGVLVKRAERLSACKPSAFIFHVSRCGSTLLAQMLVAHHRFTVLAEVPLLDAVLRLDSVVPELNKKEQEHLFSSVLALIVGDKPEGHYTVIKTDSWHSLFHARLRAWFPSVPFFLLHRNSTEVAASHRRLPGMHAVAGVLPSSLFGLDREQAAHMSREEYFSHVLSAYYRAYIKIISENKHAFLLDYENGPEQLLRIFLEKCRIALPQDEVALMIERASYHSKNPAKVFSPDLAEYDFNGLLSEAEELRNAFIHAGVKNR